MRVRGFTLIELTIAIVLLAIGLLALTGALAQALRATTDARLAHAAMREVEGIADSIADAAAVSAGLRRRTGYRVEWAAADCIAAGCIRVTAVLPRDTLSLMTAMRGSAP